MNLPIPVSVRVRQGLAVALMAYGAFVTLRVELRALATPGLSYRFDPAVLFYLVAVVGLVLRLFWARYLTICFAAALTAIAVLWSPYRVDVIARDLGLIGLLWGGRMHALFEGRAQRSNRWAADLDGRVQRLRLLFVAQSVTLGVLFAARDELSPVAGPVVAVAGLALAGLVFMRTWAALVMVPVLGLETYVAATTLGGQVRLAAGMTWAAPFMLLTACVVSFMVLAPLLTAFWRRLTRA